MKEAGGKHALYADPKNHEELANQMAKLANDNELNKKLVENIGDHLAQFSQEKIAQDLMNIYRK
jgi:glycosyltransferase involved in cell wall biosynthesis